MCLWLPSLIKLYGEAGLSSLGAPVTTGPIILAPDDDDDDDDDGRCVQSSWWNENWQGKPKYSRKTCPSNTLPITNPTCLDLEPNASCCSRKMATKIVTFLKFLITNF
jgi:hypothetical protein